MILIYRLLFLPVFLLFLPKYFLHMVKRGGYCKDLRQRFGFGPVIKKNIQKKRIWLQAVSVGEVNAIEKFVDLLSADPRVELFITSTSSTGYALARKKYSDKVKFVGIFPWDFWLFSSLAWNRIQPDVAILTESELWPEHIYQAGSRSIPVYVINGRMSDRSYAKYSNVKLFLKKFLNKISYFFVSGANTYEYFLNLGVNDQKISLCGNMKFDCNSCELSVEQSVMLKKSCGFNQDSKIVLGSSTWPGEEEMMIEAFSVIKKNSIYDWKLLICPRHSERRDEISKILNKNNFAWHQRSLGDAPNEVDVCLADTTGELKNLTQLAEFAFIGRSLAPNNGGQSPLDCAAYGIPMVYGNYMTNFKEICNELESNHCVIKAKDKEQAINFLIKCANDTFLCQDLAKNLKQWHKKHIGASQATYEDLIKRIF